MEIKIYSLFVLFLGTFGFAQQDFFALSGQDSKQIIFRDFRVLDVNKGLSGEILLSSSSKPNVFSEVRNMWITEESKSNNNALATQMASLASDAKGNLVYMPLLSGNIYVLNNKTKEIILVESNVPKTVACDLKTHFTRMTTAADGSFFALNNSGSQLIQISNTTGKYSVKDLGAVSDIASNGEFQLAKMQTGFGGDMIADRENNLYVFSASGNIFKVSVQDLRAEFLGTIKGLPEHYSLNGAAVDKKGNVIVASAKGQGFYTVNLENLQATPLAKNFDLNVYDLASHYQIPAARGTSAVFSKIEVYPTQVNAGVIHLRYNDEVKGNITFGVYDTAGKLVLNNTVKAEKNSVQTFDLSLLNSGVYIIHVSDGMGKELLTKKILVNY